MSDVLTQYHVDSDDRLIVNRVQDVEPILERAKALHNDSRFGTKDYRHLASLPKVLVEDYCNRAGITFADFMEDEAHVKRMLTDPSLSYFRVHKGGV